MATRVAENNLYYVSWWKSPHKLFLKTVMADTGAKALAATKRKFGSPKKKVYSLGDNVGLYAGNPRVRLIVKRGRPIMKGTRIDLKA